MIRFTTTLALLLALTPACAAEARIIVQQSPLAGFQYYDGKVLWETRLGSQIMGTPVTFSVKGRQYVAVSAGGGYNTISPQLKPELDQVAGGNMVYVFALPEAGK